MDEQIKKLKDQINAIKAIEDSLNDEEKKELYKELQLFVDSLNTDIEEYLSKMASLKK